MPRDDNTFKQTIGRPGSTCFRLLVSLIYVFYRHPSLFLLLMISLSAATFTALYQEQNTLQELYGIIENPRQKLAHLTRRDELFVARVRHIELHNRGIACSLPKIDPFHESVAKHMKDYGPLHCPGAMYSGLDSRKHSLSVRGRNLSRVSVQSITRPYQDDFGFKLERTEFLFKAEKTTIRRIEKGFVGCLQHTSGLCVHPFGGLRQPAERTELVLHADCGLERIYFIYEDSGLLRHKDSRKCVQARGTAEAGIVLELSSTCNTTTASFEITTNGAVRHRASSLCVQPVENPGDPANDERLVLRTRCGNDTAFGALVEGGFALPGTLSDANITHSVDFDFVQVNIELANGDKQKEFHAHVFPKPEVLTRPIKTQGMGLDVMMIMFDSTSEAQFRRKMPKTRHFLEKELKTVFFEGEGIVGDGTTAQLSAMLTGIAEENQPEARRGRPGAESVDKWRWIFSEYSRHGYATLFSEDDPSIAAFNLRLEGFQERPTDHYARPFWIALEKHKRVGQNQRFCAKAQKIHQLTFLYLSSFQESYSGRPKFSLVIFSDLTHGDENALSYADEDFLEFITLLRNDSHLNNSIVVIFGDHGYRFGKYRKLIQGKLEERLPFLSITVPTWFPEKFSEFFRNLQHNSKVLTSPFDVYAMLKHVISYPENPAGVNTGQSLFTNISTRNRTCALAGIEPHWCPCMDWEPVSTNEPAVQNIGHAVVHYMNRLVTLGGGSKALCHNLTLKQINHAAKQMAKMEVRKFRKTRKSQRCDSCVAIFGPESSDSSVSKTVYQIQFVVSPSGGLFEASVRLRDEGILINPGEISRIDPYGDTSHCIRESHAHLLKYCYCKDPPLTGK